MWNYIISQIKINKKISAIKVLIGTVEKLNNKIPNRNALIIYICNVSLFSTIYDYNKFILIYLLKKS